MKAYGLRRGLTGRWLDCADIGEGGRKSSISQPQGKGGDIHNSFRNASAKRATRRIWKRKARRAGKNACACLEV